MHREDCKYLDRYPISVYKSRDRKPTCRVCQNYLAKYFNLYTTYMSDLLKFALVCWCASFCQHVRYQKLR